MPSVETDLIGRTMDRDSRSSPGAAGPLVLVAISHPLMRALTCELLAHDCRCRVAGVAGGDRRLADAIDRDPPDLVVLDTSGFPACYAVALTRFPSQRVIVIGPEPDDSYRTAALAAGAAAWLPRDRVGDDLGAEVCRVLDLATPGLVDENRFGEEHPS